MKDPSTSLNPEHLDWLVQYSSENQSLSLELYKLLHEHDNKLSSELERELGERAQKLVAISCSLWRAVFLTDDTDSHKRAYEGAKRFLGKIVLDNNINFTQDRDNRGWTFYYYVNNARMRLETISRLDSELKKQLEVNKNGVAKKQWETCHLALRHAINEFREDLRGR